MIIRAIQSALIKVYIWASHDALPIFFTPSGAAVTRKPGSDLPEDPQRSLCVLSKREKPLELRLCVGTTSSSRAPTS